MKIDGSVFIVTGGASGLGAQVARSIISEGGLISILDVNSNLAIKLADELGKNKCYFHGPTDVTIESEVELAIQRTMLYFNNATIRGTILCSGIVKPPKSLKGYAGNLTSFAQFEHIIKINLLGTYCVAQKVAEKLLENKPINEDGEKGIIITVSSILGLDGLLVGYGTSKAGIAGLTLPLAKELAPFGIRVMCIAPGVFDTPLVNQSSESEGTPLSLFPHRLGNPIEFSNLVLQIIKMPMLNGSIIRLDGALTV
ncbi:short-chain dehydrogenase/reductase SDR [Cokeromyces recurvatus]|uniref:short-chain dehydrogenase/reductase SDR n=1 Tax=Cokeromyces recurvatus TaxID=90255 RepID=UPI002220BD6B|nr:short-chain dehydrogenase/reductase SDR [Cokeromyces recurvatus]KAI7897533.1 short-chain dehydrogenase/reductase SDR [Cokeromyces recurvatus]